MKKFYNNLMYAILAQLIATIFNLIMYLLVPKVIGNISYAYWQLFLFYTNYAGFFHLGLVDGIYLKLGGKKYGDLDYNTLGSQLKIMFGFQVIIGIIGIIFVNILNIETERIFIIYCTIIYIIIYCVENFLGFVLQSVNLTKKYSIAVIIEKIISLVLVVIIMSLKINSYKPYIYVFLFAKIINVIYLIINAKEIVFSKFVGIKNTIKEVKDNILIGIILMLSTIASSLIIGSGRMVIDNIWGIENFGKISFTISMVNMVLLFIRQVSMVMFPALREVDDTQKAKMYNFTRTLMDVILPFVFLVYVPLSKILCLWLPQYGESIRYLSIILPICVYDAKMQVICNTYFKVLRKEKFLLVINVAIMILSVILSIISGYILKSMIVVTISMVVSVIIRSIISEIYLNKNMNSKIKTIIPSIVLEFIVTVIFMISSWYLNEIYSLLIMCIVMMIYVVFNYKQIKSIILVIRNKGEKIFNRV